MKSSPGNIAVDSVDHLAAIIRNRLKRIQYRPDLIPGFLAQTGLSLEPEPPSPKQTPDFQPLHQGTRPTTRHKNPPGKDLTDKQKRYCSAIDASASARWLMPATTTTPGRFGSFTPTPTSQLLSSVWTTSRAGSVTREYGPPDDRP
ncbi:hypothetical protein KBX37_28860 [Micromonospora sp. U56]|uniref:hypothetical protein n=1 Tax=Micromonospora sp. U56 TaxID=2824900 RepID=UPI001B3705D2|nr:hypothetical protein [Micromonospora sp. U56]MBQ0897049.1 hypothetical protein [Micromonospora sp. U56]